MGHPAVSAERLSKRFRLGKRERYHTIRDALSRLVRAPLRLFGRDDGAPWLWAVKDVSFAIQPSEVVGIIGRNGAGKSTLLKVLSRITEPTEGRAIIRGRLASLLEVGTGFHPELSGRENIFLNGAVLGMTRAEIRRKFDEIVAFAEVERSIDTAVKHYSSGMYLRLAFAIAAHLEPEILVVDEVLAVGDARFQRRCLEKMDAVGRSGRTVLFVSHNMPAITRLCPRTILLDQGGILLDGPSPQVVSEYLKSGLGIIGAREWDAASAPGSEAVHLRAVRVRRLDGVIADSVDIRQAITLEVDYDVEKPEVLYPNFHVFNDDGICMFVTSDLDPAWRGRARPPGRYRSFVEIPGNLLAEGTVIVTVAISTFSPQKVHLLERDAIAFQVIDSLDGDSARGDYAGPLPGVVRPRLVWRTERVDAVDAA